HHRSFPPSWARRVEPRTGSTVIQTVPLKSENPPSVAESVATNVGGTVAAAAVGGVLAAGGAPILVVAGVGMLMGFGAAWAISKLW
ncbi:hypothetical protein, partial [Rhodococcoides yunnanense]|uniref:hypothetical protein n=1 Tax=Rhodococcoides yunnanense TaxID=278209 RepID=UPI0022B1A26A